jgi:hypothetical protein
MIFATNTSGHELQLTRPLTMRDFALFVQALRAEFPERAVRMDKIPFFWV